MSAAPEHALCWRFQPQNFLRQRRDQLGLGHHVIERIGVLNQQLQTRTNSCCRGFVAGGQEINGDDGHQLLHGEGLAVLITVSNGLADQIVPGVFAPLCHHVSKVGLHLNHQPGAFDPALPGGHHAERLNDGVRPDLELPNVGARHAQQIRNDHHREGVREVLNKLHFRTPFKLVEQ